MNNSWSDFLKTIEKSWTQELSQEISLLNNKEEKIKHIELETKLVSSVLRAASNDVYNEAVPEINLALEIWCLINNSEVISQTEVSILGKIRLMILAKLLEALFKKEGD